MRRDGYSDYWRVKNSSLRMAMGVLDNAHTISKKRNVVSSRVHPKNTNMEHFIKEVLPSTIREDNDEYIVGSWIPSYTSGEAKYTFIGFWKEDLLVCLSWNKNVYKMTFNPKKSDWIKVFVFGSEKHLDELNKKERKELLSMVKTHSAMKET
jgi:hypothetical protein